MFAATSRVLDQMLDCHGSSRADLYKLAAQWEITECKCIDKARDYLMKGIHVHKYNKMLLSYLFNLELLNTAQRRKECIGKIIISILSLFFKSKVFKMHIIYFD